MQPPRSGPSAPPPAADRRRPNDVGRGCRGRRRSPSLRRRRRRRLREITPQQLQSHPRQGDPSVVHRSLRGAVVPLERERVGLIEAPESSRASVSDTTRISGSRSAASLPPPRSGRGHVVRARPHGHPRLATQHGGRDVAAQHLAGAFAVEIGDDVVGLATSARVAEHCAQGALADGFEVGALGQNGHVVAELDRSVPVARSSRGEGWPAPGSRQDAQLGGHVVSARRSSITLAAPARSPTVDVSSARTRPAPSWYASPCSIGEIEGGTRGHRVVPRRWRRRAVRQDRDRRRRAPMHCLSGGRVGHRRDQVPSDACRAEHAELGSNDNALPRPWRVERRGRTRPHPIKPPCSASANAFSPKCSVSGAMGSSRPTQTASTTRSASGDSVARRAVTRSTTAAASGRPPRESRDAHGDGEGAVGRRGQDGGASIPSRQAESSANSVVAPLGTAPIGQRRRCSGCRLSVAGRARRSPGHHSSAAGRSRRAGRVAEHQGEVVGQRPRHERGRPISSLSRWASSTTTTPSARPSRSASDLTVGRPRRYGPPATEERRTPRMRAVH